MVWSTPKTWVAPSVPTAGDLNTHLRDQLNAIGGTWTSYTPTWTSSGSPAVGNGSLTGYYMQAGKLIHARIRLLIGSSTTISTGIYTFALPAPAAALQYECLGSAHMYDDSAGNYYPGIAYRPGTSSACSLVFGTARWSAAAPVAPAQNDVIAVNLSYEAA